MFKQKTKNLWNNLKRFRNRLLLKSTHPSLKTLEFGNHSYNIPNIIRHKGDKNSVKIGSFCSIAANVNFFVGGNHRIDWVSTYPFRIKFDLPEKFTDGHPASNGDINVGSDVWIGNGATVFSGVTIGHGAVIAGKAVVTKNVPPYSIVAGNPAKIIKQRFTDKQIADLLEIAWWEWPIEQILDTVDKLCDDKIDVFIQYAKNNPAN